RGGIFVSALKLRNVLLKLFICDLCPSPTDHLHRRLGATKRMRAVIRCGPVVQPGLSRTRGDPHDACLASFISPRCGCKLRLQDSRTRYIACDANSERANARLGPEAE